MSRREPVEDQTTDACGCIRTPVHGVIDACGPHNPWERHDLDDVYFVRIRITGKVNCEFELFNRLVLRSLGQVNEEDLDALTPTALGYCKWDECSNWSITPSVHFCDREEVVAFGGALTQVYDLALAKVGGSL
jgi:hypothetical protein